MRQPVALVNVEHRRLDVLVPGVRLNLLDRRPGLNRQRASRVPQGVGADAVQDAGCFGVLRDDAVHRASRQPATHTVPAQ